MDFGSGLGGIHGRSSVGERIGRRSFPSRIKQHFELDRALRTETTINDTSDFDVGRLLGSLEDLKTTGLQANRRLLRVERLSHNATLGPTCFEQLNRPCESVGQRAPALGLGDPRV